MTKKTDWLKYKIDKYEETKDITYLIDALGILKTIVTTEQDEFRRSHQTSDYEAIR